MAPPRTQRARELRKTMTGVELMLWARLRRRQLLGFKFRRQASIGPYVADFACLSQRLIVEVDGPAHDFMQVHDRVRTAWFCAYGYREFRVSASDALRDRDAVLDGIALLLVPLPGPSGRTSP